MRQTDTGQRRINSAWVFRSHSNLLRSNSNPDFVELAFSTLRAKGIPVEYKGYDEFPKKGEPLRDVPADLMAFGFGDELKQIRSDPAAVIVNEVEGARKTPVVGISSVNVLRNSLIDGRLREQAHDTLSLLAYREAADWERVIGRWSEDHSIPDAIGDIPNSLLLSAHLHQKLRYGENPHQKAGLYVVGQARCGAASARQLQGKELSYNNYNDTDAAFELVGEFNSQKTCAVAIIKHANPCGVAVGRSLKEAYIKALECDPVSAFGGIVALNRPIDAESALEITKTFTEVVIAPGASTEASAILASKKDLRLLIADSLPNPRVRGLVVRTLGDGLLAHKLDGDTSRSVGLEGALLVQSGDHRVIDDVDLRDSVRTRREPTHREWRDLRFAFKVCKHVKSNAIVFAKDGATVGIGAGQMSRVDSVKIAAWKAEHVSKRGKAGLVGSVVASDAFFPFADGIREAALAGARAIIQPGGSLRDKDVIREADDREIAMVFTDSRHFRH